MTPRKRKEDYLQVGRPSKYYPEICDEIVKFFDRPLYEEVNGKVMPNRLPTFERFAMDKDLHTDTLVEWEKIYPEFSVAYKKAKQIQVEHITQHAMLGGYQQPFSIFFLKNCHQWKDKQEIDSNTNISVNYKEATEADAVNPTP